MQKDILVVGQGLAGSLLALFLYKKGLTVRIIDPCREENCTSVSSGIINPITGRRFVKSWMIDDLIPVAVRTYRNLEETLGISLFKETSIVRTLHGIKDENQWLMQSGKPGYERYMSDDLPNKAYSRYLNSSDSFASVKEGYHVNASLLMTAFRRWFMEQNLLTAASFDYGLLSYDGSNYQYDGLRYKSIVFCEGWRVIHNPYFNALPFQPFKGEVFTCHIPQFPDGAILKFKKFFVPLGNDEFWVGTTNQWDFEDESPDPEMIAELEDFLKTHLRLPFHIESKRAGVRPATKFRRPFVGEHPKHPRMYILNGLGTKGFSLAPYWAEHLADCIVDGRQAELETTPHFLDILSGSG